MNPFRAYRRARTAFRTFNDLRKARKRKKLEESGVQLSPKGDRPVKEFLVKKAKASVRSSTMGVAGLIVTAGLWLQTNPEILSAVVPEGYSGVALAVVGLLVALARLRTAGK